MLSDWQDQARYGGEEERRRGGKEERRRIGGGEEEERRRRGERGRNRNKFASKVTSTWRAGPGELRLEGGPSGGMGGVGQQFGLQS